MAYENFKKIIPVGLQEKIKSLAEEMDFREIISGHQESITEQEISPIEGNYCSGWIPWQDGGFSVDQFFVNDMDPARHFTENQTEWVENSYNDMLESFCQDNDIEEIDYNDQELLNQLCDYENNWFEPALLQFQVFVERENRFDDNSPMSIVCRLSINYKDAPYYREKHAEDIRVISYSLGVFLQTENSDIIEGFKL